MEKQKFQEFDSSVKKVNQSKVSKESKEKIFEQLKSLVD